MGRIHYEIPNQLHREAKELAVSMPPGTLKAFVIQAMQEKVDRERARRAVAEVQRKQRPS